jgi:hypothetical protein
MWSLLNRVRQRARILADLDTMATDLHHFVVNCRCTVSFLLFTSSFYHLIITAIFLKYGFKTNNNEEKIVVVIYKPFYLRAFTQI